MTSQPSSNKTTVLVLASGDMRLSANQVCWPAQAELEKALGKVLSAMGYPSERAHAYKSAEKHGFISSQHEGIQAFRKIDPFAPLIIAEAVWQYSHHVLPGLTTHRGPVLTLANWSGRWPGLVGMLNLNGSLTKAGIRYSTLWSQDFTDEFFINHLRAWLETGSIRHDTSHARPLASMKVPVEQATLGKSLARDLLDDKTIIGVFDEGCMGMYNAIIPDQALHACGVFKERLSQSALFHETMQVPEEDARGVRDWLDRSGMRFHTGSEAATDLTEIQIMLQCKMYVAALRMADDFGCEAIGIQYQQGLKDLLPASDLVEGMLNNSDRPPVRSRDGMRILLTGKPLVHFNEVDECAGLDGLMTRRVHEALGQPVENTLHDVRWGALYRDEFVWVFLISGAAPPAHFIDGWKGAHGFRQPAMYFPSGGSTLHGVSKPGEIVWSRIFVKGEELHMDIGRGKVVELPEEETRARLDATTPQWPIMHAVTYGVSRDQFMAKHQANHIQVAYADNAGSATACLFAKASFARELGITVTVCGTLDDPSKSS